MACFSFFDDVSLAEECHRCGRMSLTRRIGRRQQWEEQESAARMFDQSTATMTNTRGGNEMSLSQSIPADECRFHSHPIPLFQL